MFSFPNRNNLFLNRKQRFPYFGTPKITFLLTLVYIKWIFQIIDINRISLLWYTKDNIFVNFGVPKEDS